jgi:hemoglobin
MATESLYDHAGGDEGLHRLEVLGAHVAQQNSRARTDAELHPIREVPHWDWPGR